MVQRAEVVVIGGGVIGTSIAAQLVEKGLGRVILLERGALASGSTGRSVAICTPAYSSEINARMALLGFRGIRDMAKELGHDPGFVPRPQLLAITKPLGTQKLEAVVRMHHSLGIESRLVDDRGMAEVFPELNREDLAAGIYLPEGGFADPHLVTNAYAAVAEAGGATILRKASVQGIKVQEDRVAGVTAAGETFEAQVVVNAAGPWCNEVNAMVGLEAPVQVWQRMIYLTSPHHAIPNDRPIFEDTYNRFYFRQELNGGFILGLVEDRPPVDKDDVQLDWYFLPKALEAAVHRVPLLQQTKVVGGWSGLVTYTPDHCPLLGAWGPGGYYVANGMSGYGFTISYAVGVTMAELIAQGKARTVDIHPLRPTRFDEGQPVIDGGLWMKDHTAGR